MLALPPRASALAGLGILGMLVISSPTFGQATLSPAPGYTITYNGNQQSFFSNTWDGTSQQSPTNIALSSAGSTAFASSAYGAGVHETVFVNDGVYGNNRSWLPAFGDGLGGSAHVGVAFPALQSLTSVAWGRDNGRNGQAVPGGGGDTPGGNEGQFADRATGEYLLQITTDASPGSSSTWTNVGTITIQSSTSSGFLDYYRHEFDVRTSAGAPIAATGVRLVTSWPNVFDNAQIVDELEIYRATWWTGGSAVWSSTTAWQTAASGGTSTTPYAGDSVVFAQATSAPQAITLGADRAARGIAVTTGDAVSLTGGGTDRTLALGWAGDLTTSVFTDSVTLAVGAAAGAVTIGSQTAGQRVPIALNATQSWVNDSANLLTVHNDVSRVASDTSLRYLTIRGSGATTVNGAISNGGSGGTLGLIKDGAGTVTLTAANSYTGVTSLNSGTLVFDSAANQTLPGQVQGSGAIVKRSSGTLAFTGPSTHTGGFTIEAGTVQLGNTGELGQSLVTLADAAGATLELTGTAATIGWLQGGGASGGNVVLNAATLRIAAVGFDSYYYGTISGSGGLAVVGAGAVRLEGQQTYTGPTTISAGYLVLPANVDNGLSPQTVVTMTAGYFDLSNRPQTIAGLAGTGGEVYSFPAAGTNGRLTLDVASATTHTYGGVIGGAGSFTNFGLTKAGAGTQILSGANTYTGNTAVDAGRLTVNGSIGAGAVSVANAAILAGSGTIGGPVNIAAGGILAPGNSPGTLTVNNSLALAGTSIIDFEINAANTTAGGGINDLIAGVTNLTLDGVLNLSGSGDFSSVTQGTTWRLINYSGSLTDNMLSIGTAPTLAAGLSFNVDTSTANQVNLVVVPEPGAAVLAAIGVAAAAAIARRRGHRA